jgi:pimeloyl-ACP methyl ester carboxylesterase
MSNLPSPFKSKKGEAEYMAAYEASMKLWPVPYEHRDITGRNGRTHLVAAGPEGAPALVLLHMDYLSLTMWAANIADLSRDYRVYAVDVMGQPGKSVPDKPIRNREDAVAWISEVLDGLELEKVTLAGASYGGWFTLNYAIRSPQRLDRIALLSPGGSFLNERPTFYLNVLPAMILPFLPQRLLFDRFMRSTTFQENLRDPVVHTIDECLRHQTYLGFRHFRLWKHWAEQSIKPHVFPDEELRGMHVPTLLLIGEQEVLYDPVAALERARKLVPNLEGELVPRASHDMTMGQHERVNKRVLEFLKGAAQPPLAGDATLGA